MAGGLNDRPVLVTGASGYVGQHLAGLLADGGTRVAGTFLSNPLDLGPVEMVPVDLRDGGAVDRLVRDMRPAAVFHCAAMTRGNQCEDDPAGAERAIVGATENLARALARRAPATPLLMLSTDLVFDGEGAPYDEQAGAKPLGVYGGLKYRAEGVVRTLDRGTVVRSALVYGPPARNAGSFLQWMVKAIEGGDRLVLFADEVRTPILVADLCGAVVDLMRRGCTGLWHAGGPERLDRVEMGRRLCARMGAGEDLIEAVPLAEARTTAPRPRDVSLDSTRLWQATGLSPHTFDQGLAAALGQ